MPMPCIVMRPSIALGYIIAWSRMELLRLRLPVVHGLGTGRRVEHEASRPQTESEKSKVPCSVQGDP